MKETIEKFKQENGNEKFTLKEMMMYTITKGDKRDEEIKKINKQLGKGAGKIAVNRTTNEAQDKSIALLWKVVIVLLTAATTATGGYAIFG